MERLRSSTPNHSPCSSLRIPAVSTGVEIKTEFIVAGIDRIARGTRTCHDALRSSPIKALTMKTFRH